MLPVKRDPVSLAAELRRVGYLRSCARAHWLGFLEHGFQQNPQRATTYYATHSFQAVNQDKLLSKTLMNCETMVSRFRGFAVYHTSMPKKILVSA